MSVLFKPAIKIMNSLSFKSKLFLIGFITTLIVTILSVQLSYQSLSIMNFSKTELVGVIYVEKLSQIMEDIQKHRNLETDYLLGDRYLKDKLINLRDRIDQLIDDALEYENKIDDNLKTRESLLFIKSAWELIKGNIIIDPTKSNFITTSNLIGNIQNLIITACDNSNLTLDPNIDTFYLMDSVCTKLPSFTEQISLIRDIGVNALFSKKLTDEDREKLSIYKTLSDNFNKVAIKNNFDKVSEILEQKTAKPSEFDAYIDVIYSQTSNLTNLLNNTILSNKFDMKPSLFSEKYFTLLDETYKLDQKSGTVLYGLIAERVNKMLNHLYFNLALAVISLVVLIYLYIGMYLAIIKSLKKLIQGSEKLSKGNFDAQVHLDTKDELIDVAKSFNTMCNAITSIDKEISHMLDNILKGSFNEEITKEYYGSFSDLKNSINKIVDDARKSTQFFKKTLSAIEGSINNIHEDQQMVVDKTKSQIKNVDVILVGNKQMQLHNKQAFEYNKRNYDLLQTISSHALDEKVLIEQINERMANLEDILNKLFFHTINVIDKLIYQINLMSSSYSKESNKLGSDSDLAAIASSIHELAQYVANAGNEVKGLMSPVLRKITLTNKRINETYQMNQNVIKTISHLTSLIAKANFTLTTLGNNLEGNSHIMVLMKEDLIKQYALTLAVDDLVKKMTHQLDNIDRNLTVI